MDTVMIWMPKFNGFYILLISFFVFNWTHTPLILMFPTMGRG